MEAPGPGDAVSAGKQLGVKAKVNEPVHRKIFKAQEHLSG